MCKLGVNFKLIFLFNCCFVLNKSRKIKSFQSSAVKMLIYRIRTAYYDNFWILVALPFTPNSFVSLVKSLVIQGAIKWDPRATEICTSCSLGIRLCYCFGPFKWVVVAQALYFWRGSLNVPTFGFACPTICRRF